MDVELPPDALADQQLQAGPFARRGDGPAMRKTVGRILLDRRSPDWFTDRFEIPVPEFPELSARRWSMQVSGTDPSQDRERLFGRVALLPPGQDAAADLRQARRAGFFWLDVQHHQEALFASTESQAAQRRSRPDVGRAEFHDGGGLGVQIQHDGTRLWWNSTSTPRLLQWTGIFPSEPSATMKILRGSQHLPV